jgi:hypothetical protein
VESVDARPSDALNLVGAGAGADRRRPEVLQEAEARREGDTAEAARLRRALVASPMTIESVGTWAQPHLGDEESASGKQLR